MSDLSWQAECLEYVGRSQQSTDDLPANTTNCLLATLNDPARLNIGDKLPPLFHWLYFHEPIANQNLKRDGHAKLGDFLPPVRYPQRMWAGSEVQFLHDLHLGQKTTRHSTIKSVEFKAGRSGDLCFVKVEHRYQQNQKDCLIDIHIIVYKQQKMAQAAVAETQVTETSDHQKFNQSLDEVTLFRYSALTFNSHRIHYDLDYCRNVEGYPSLVVHGPLMATLLMRAALAQTPHRKPAAYRFRGLSPVFMGDPFCIQSKTTEKGLHLSLVKIGDVTAMQAHVEWC